MLTLSLSLSLSLQFLHRFHFKFSFCLFPRLRKSLCLRVFLLRYWPFPLLLSRLSTAVPCLLFFLPLEVTMSDLPPRSHFRQGHVRYSRPRKVRLQLMITYSSLRRQGTGGFPGRQASIPESQWSTPTPADVSNSATMSTITPPTERIKLPPSSGTTPISSPPSQVWRLQPSLPLEPNPALNHHAHTTPMPSIGLAWWRRPW